MSTSTPNPIAPSLSHAVAKSQLLLFGQPAKAPAEFRPPSNSTTTSAAAAESLLGCVRGLRLEVLRNIVACGDYGATADEIQVALSMRPQTCSARCNELRRAGLIVRDGRTRPTDSGRAAYVYIATAAGRQEVARA